MHREGLYPITMVPSMVVYPKVVGEVDTGLKGSPGWPGVAVSEAGAWTVAGVAAEVAAAVVAALLLLHTYGLLTA